MSFFDGLNAEQYDRQYTDRDLTRRIAQYFRPQWRRLILVAVLMLSISLLGAVNPWITSQGVNWIESGAGGGDGWLLIPGALLVTGVLAWIANMMARRQAVRAVADVLMALSTQAFESAVRHDLSFYDRFSSGKVVSRITSDTRDFGNMVTLVAEVIVQIVESIAVALILVSIEPRLALYVFALVPLVLGIALWYRSLARRATRKGMQAMANVNSAIKETISGIAIAKNFRQETAIFAEFDQANRESYAVNVRRGFVLTLVYPTLNIMGGWALAFMVYVGGMNVVQGAVTLGAWYLFLLSLDRFMFPVMNLSSFWTQVQSGLSAAERIFALIDAEPAVRQTDVRPVPKLRGQIEFEGVNFRYGEGEGVLCDFSLQIAAGENIALVGHTGAGKSSIAKLVARFYEFQEGRLLIDGLDIRSLDLSDYRKQLGIVSQTPFLFSGTVLENIRYALPEISESEVLRVAKRIGDGEWLETLPQGLQTLVGERGTLLSMGQRQLVSLMRVLVQKPAIFILDEATASIDPFTEWQIQQALNLILSEATSIMIAHRLSTVKSADRILVMESGGIIEQGSHQRLLEQGGHYAELYNTYFRHQSLDYRPEGLDEVIGPRD